jgi:hypothetical protein
MSLRALSALFLLSALVSSGFAYEREDYEEDAGATFAFLLNPEDGIYGASFGSGTWLKDTPVFGDYFVRIFWNGIEESTYSGMGMTLRIMPHWPVAPFVGGGGSYNLSLAQKSDEAAVDSRDPDDPPDKGESYWAGHGEAGLRINLTDRTIMLEAAVSQSFISLKGERDYWLLGLTFGTGF